MKRVDVPIPARLAQRPKDKRGYPIPFIVHIDAAGKPHFQINDIAFQSQAMAEKRCGLCGGKLGDNIWVIGGPNAAFHPKGGYIDPPVHKDCGTYALRVCPFLAVRYSKRIDMKTNPTGSGIVTENNMPSEQPPFFVFARTSRIELWDASHNEPAPRTEGELIRTIAGGSTVMQIPKRPFREVEFWKDGECITSEDAERLFEQSDAKSVSRTDLTWWSN